MPAFSFWPADADQRWWVIKLLSLLLVAALLCYGTWLYYADKVRQLEQQERQLLKAGVKTACALTSYPLR